jgi:hypothetical protein
MTSWTAGRATTRSRVGPGATPSCTTPAPGTEPTDFDNADDIIALHGFATADMKVRAEGSDTVLDLPGPDQITLQGVSAFNADGILYDITRIVR